MEKHTNNENNWIDALLNPRSKEQGLRILGGALPDHGAAAGPRGPEQLSWLTASPNLSFGAGSYPSPFARFQYFFDQKKRKSFGGKKNVRGKVSAEKKQSKIDRRRWICVGWFVKLGQARPPKPQG